MIESTETKEAEPPYHIPLGTRLYASTNLPILNTHYLQEQQVRIQDSLLAGLEGSGGQVVAIESMVLKKK